MNQRQLRIVGIKEAKASLSSLVTQARGSRVLLTSRRRPVAVLVGLDPAVYDMEDVVVMADEEFWKMIAARRTEPTLPWARVNPQAGLPGKRIAAPKRARRRRAA